MKRRRTPERELAAFKRRVEELFRKEARCPACAKAARLAKPGEPRICETHQRIRHEMAFSGMKR